MKKDIHIEGMNCGHCAASVEKALRAVTGVAEARVDLAAKKAGVLVDGSVSDADLSAAVVGAGFAVTGIADAGPDGR